MSLLKLLKDKQKFFKKVPFYPFIMQYPTPDYWTNNFDISNIIEDLIDIDINELNIYIHIPFCDYLCKYCSFSKILYNKKYKYLFLKKSEQEIDFYDELYDFSSLDIKTIYIWWWTPTTLDIDDIKYIKDIFDRYNIKTSWEFTIETNPDRIDINKFKLWKEVWVNRISVWIQTFNNDILKLYNRWLLDYDMFVLKINQLRNIWYDNINFDMIYWFSSQTDIDVVNDIKHIKLLNPEHISYYPLILYDFLIKDKPNIPIFFEKLERQYDIIKQELKWYYNFYTLEYASNKKWLKHDYQVNYLSWKNVLGLWPSWFSYIKNIWFKNKFSLFEYLKQKFFFIEYLYKVKDKIILAQKNFLMWIRLNKIIWKDIDYLKEYYNMDEIYNFFILDNNWYYVLKNEYLKYQDLLQYYFYNLFKSWK